MTVKDRVLRFLRSGRSMSVAQGRAMFKAQNIAARVNELRNEGFVIYSNVRTRADGSKVTTYRLGTPTKAFVRNARDWGMNYQPGV